jgi:ribosome-associated protein
VKGTAEKKPSKKSPKKPAVKKAPVDVARQFALAAAKLVSDTRCHNVQVLDVREISTVTDYMVLATGTSARQMKSVADELEELGQTTGYGALSATGGGDSNWIAIDFFNVMVHLFDQEARMYYDLDGMWGDAPKVEWEPAEAVGAGR